ncbi:hypothetical protein [Algisphaera agarilytica]|uniref:Uncharacterized protein n=1 Tax=Algisphaera agarilytica TaxID=1385975 RepID=A0A7X0LK87_9BACT|nr:hypothetical protein [Algisphaera agarilytica]MBB6429662.1 hypothetical protein [Algisphaera agarilytica]
MPVSESLIPHRKRIEFDPAQLHIQGTSATNFIWAEVFHDGSDCLLQPSRRMVVSAIVSSAVVGAIFIAAGWAANKWMSEPEEMLFWIKLMGVFTVSVMLSIYAGTHYVLRQRGPWLSANLKDQTLHSRIARKTWPLDQVDGLIVLEGQLSISNTRHVMQEIKVVVSGQVFHVYSQAKMMRINVKRTARRFAEITGLPVEYVNLSKRG